MGDPESCVESMSRNVGQPGQAWQWFKDTGVVTRGDYADIGSGTNCWPYSLAPCGAVH